MRLFYIFIFCFAFTLACTHSAKADVYVWQDAQTGLVLSYPDTWSIVSNNSPDDILTIHAPSGRAHAMCRARVRNDERFLIYPTRFSESVQEVAYNTQFWDYYFREFTGPDFKLIKNGSGLGRAFAGYAIAEYTSAVPGPEMVRRGLAFAGNYNGQLFILECSSHKDAFGEWKGPFLSIADSVEMPKAYHELMTGDYRNFLNENNVPLLRFKGTTSTQRKKY